MRTDKAHMDQISEISALRSEVSYLKAMMSVMQQIRMNRNKQIAEIHKSLFNNPIKSKVVLREKKGFEESDYNEEC